VGETLQSGRDAVHYPEYSVPHNTSLPQDWDLRSESCDLSTRQDDLAASRAHDGLLNKVVSL